MSNSMPDLELELFEDGIRLFSSDAKDNRVYTLYSNRNPEIVSQIIKGYIEANNNKVEENE